MSPKIYTSSYPSVPVAATSLFTHHLTSSSDLVGGFPSSSPAFIDSATGITITRADLRKSALQLAYGIRSHELQLKRGDTVMVFSPNSISWPVVMFGLFGAGMKGTLANSAYTSRELAWQWADSRAKLVFVAPELLPIVLQMFEEIGIKWEEGRKKVVIMDDGWLTGGNQTNTGYAGMEELLGKGTFGVEEKFDGKDADETVLLCYSSGTTGKPKGVETTHRNILTILNIVPPTFTKMVPGKDVVLGILPFYHIYGAVMILNFALHSNIPTVIQPRFDPVAFCANVQRYKVRDPLKFLRSSDLELIKSNDDGYTAVDQYDVSTLCVFMSGAAPLGASLVNEVRARILKARKTKNSCGNQNFNVVQGYGLTETSPTTHLLPVPDSLRKVGSVGLLLPNLEARLVVDEDGLEDCKEGQAGELWIRGSSIMKGYLNNSKATTDSITSDGWFKTGDVAVVDKEGFYYIVDRRKELIKYKGFQVPPAELESVLLTHPEIADVAVIGIDSVKEATELPRAYVVHAHPDRVQSVQDKEAFGKGVQKWIESKVARHKFLRGGVVVIDIIPKSAAGKILRRELRERAKAELKDAKAKL